VDRRLDLRVEDLAIQEENGAERLVLCAGGDLALNGEVSEEGFNLRFAHVARVARAVEENDAPDPGEVGGFGAEGIVLAAEGFADR
jgi:hypothetical protein